ncbi:TOTE conflict system archaeo-eukaryotic primase domain-containing protein [Holophaga foetida]|uniref:TOTE conflict system archaeo-eukaryotic primase domain-containing protein n=1 Tax=Holophaga foetida TaxID=35839 RepID=UPI000247371B|nr:DEAD/DEAH box helicase [Holophaga foetida]
MLLREDLATQLELLEARLTERLKETEGIRAQIEEIRAQLQATDAAHAPDSSHSGPQSPAEKVALFRSMFRGREDVYPRLWINAKRDRKGYAPVCANEGNRTLCNKFKVKCAECPNRRFAPMDDRAVLDHLQGRHVIGVYPLLPDETCWFLAADFDGEGWKEDATAMLGTCQRYSIPAALERSRSGEGAHLWIFFMGPVFAATARKLGSFLLTETMNRRPQLSMKSYDRLFPNQDTMPQGGFGNLVALPLQQEARRQGNTLFLDQHLDPLPDPWAYLAGLGRMPTSQVETLAEAATRQGRVLGIRFDPLDDGLDETPWERPPSRKPKKARIEGQIPPTIKAVRSHQVFVEKTGLPAGLHAEIKRLAAFQNPEFYQKQAMRFSTSGIPRIICAAEEHPAHIALPRGCEEELQELLAEYGSALVIEDRRCMGDPLEVSFQGQLTEVQRTAVEAISAHALSIFVAPPGTGKTVFGAHMVALRGVNTLVLVHRKPLLDQWRAQLQAFLGLGPKDVGQIGGGKQKATGRIDVAMIQSLASRDGVLDLVGRYGQVIVDECHHAPAVSFERVMREVKARYVLGLTATPYRRDGLQRLLHFQCGPIRYQVHPLSQEGQHPFANRLIVRETRFFAQGTIQDLYAALVTDPLRNAMIIQDVRRALSEGRSPIVLTERRDHLNLLLEALKDAATYVVALHGGVPAKARRMALQRLAEVPPCEPRLILATGRYIGEGFDDARLDTLFMAMPIAWKGTLVQYAGRLHRLHPGKEEVRIYDYLDDALAVFRKMFVKRMRGYRAMGYQVDDSMMLPGLEKLDGC